MRHDDARLRDVLERAVPDDAAVLYAVVAGSHLHGVAGPDSDVDLRAVHVVDVERHALLDPPDPHVVVNQDGVTGGFADVPDVEVVSYELGRFGELVAEGNVDALEALFADEPLVATPGAMGPLCETVAEHLPLDVPRAYLGMARADYDRFGGVDGSTEPPTAKQFLRIFRTLLAAQYVTETGRIEPDVGALAAHGLDDPGLVDDLRAVRRSGADARPDDALAARADAAVRDLFAALDPDENAETSSLRAAVDRWMLDVRDGGDGPPT